ncbi:MAG: hypothetical protein K2J26_00925, partial [Ruminococcus sp.]|nr:hypothetical protein [Ruminococcus sp.]
LSSVLAVSAVPFSSCNCFALSESGIADMSGFVMKYGDFSGKSVADTLPDILSSGDDKDYLLGAHLDANNTAVYAEFSRLVNPSLEQFTVKLPEPVKFTSESRSYSGSQEFYNAVFSACASGMEAASYDIPMLFWLDINLTSVSTLRVPYTYNFWTGLYTYTLESITFTPAYGEGFSSLDEVMKYKTLLEDAVENFTAEGDTIEEQLKSIHDQICLFTDYNIEGRFPDSALGALVESGSVCEGYSKGFKILADKLGIPAVCVFGNYNAEAAEAHMWNYVRMDDGFWYAVDVTWDDYDGKYDIEFTHDFFLKGSEDFFIRHTPCSGYNLTHFEYPEIASWNYGENPAVTTSAAAETVVSEITTTAISTQTAEVTLSVSTSDLQTTTVSSTAAEFQKGDLNHDGIVSAADLVYCANYILGNGKTEHSCDINGDGRTDAFDVVEMRKIVISKTVSESE